MIIPTVSKTPAMKSVTLMNFLPKKQINRPRTIKTIEKMIELSSINYQITEKSYFGQAPFATAFTV